MPTPLIDFANVRHTEQIDWHRETAKGWQQTTFRGKLTFTYLELAVAAARMQIYKLPPLAPYLSMRLVRRIVEDLELLAEAAPVDGMLLHAPPAGWLMDFERTALSGRLGAGFSMLMMMRLGYAYVGPFDRLYAGVRGAKPDFVFQTTGGPQAFVEAKGSLTSSKKARTRARNAAKRQVKPHVWRASNTKGLAICTAVTAHQDRPRMAVYEISQPSFVNTDPFHGNGNAGQVARWFAAFSPPMFRAHWFSALELCGFHRAAAAFRWNGMATERELIEDGLMGSTAHFSEIGGVECILGAVEARVDGGNGRIRFGLERSVLDVLIEVLLGRPPEETQEAYFSPAWMSESVVEVEIAGAGSMEWEIQDDDDTRIARFPDGWVVILSDLETETSDPSATPVEQWRMSYLDENGGAMGQA